MDDSTFSVVSTGELIGGFEMSSVEARVSELFKIPPSKVSKFLSTERVVKKGIDQKQAYQYKKKLESIGIRTRIARSRKVASPDALSLAPIESEVANESNDGFKCPKCGSEQKRSEQCISCGIYFDKYSSDSTDPSSNIHDDKKVLAKEANSVEPVQTIEDDSPEGVKLASIAVGLAVALVGAFLWKVIAVTFNYELGLIAWGIGGAIGFAVAVSGSGGEKVGYYCGALAIFAIIGGKYLVVQSFQNELSNISVDQLGGEEFTWLFEMEKSAAKDFVLMDSHDEQHLKQFMIEFGYAEVDEVNQISQDEYDFFVEYSVPALEGLGNGSMDFNNWVQNRLAPVADVSTWDIMTESLGLLDALFLFLGVGTAYRLGKGQ